MSRKRHETIPERVSLDSVRLDAYVYITEDRWQIHMTEWGRIPKPLFAGPWRLGRDDVWRRVSLRNGIMRQHEQPI